MFVLFAARIAYEAPAVEIEGFVENRVCKLRTWDTSIARTARRFCVRNLWKDIYQ